MRREQNRRKEQRRDGESRALKLSPVQPCGCSRSTMLSFSLNSLMLLTSDWRWWREPGSKGSANNSSSEERAIHEDGNGKSNKGARTNRRKDNKSKNNKSKKNKKKKNKKNSVSNRNQSNTPANRNKQTQNKNKQANKHRKNRNKRTSSSGLAMAWLFACSSVIISDSLSSTSERHQREGVDPM
jgi:hypothetical protein